MVPTKDGMGVRRRSIKQLTDRISQTIDLRLPKLNGSQAWFGSIESGQVYWSKP
jgi:hypothetical protein